MENTNEHDDQALDIAAVTDEVAEPTADERGMTTAEYAVGVVLVVTVVVLIIAALRGTWFGPLIQGVVKLIINIIKAAISG